MVRKQHNWVVVADGAGARIYDNDGSGRLTLVEERQAEAVHLRTHEMVSDRQGRSLESATSAHHAMEIKSDPHDREKHKFLEGVADYVNAALAAGKFDSLTLCAPARALGDLRKFLSAQARVRVRSEVAKDLMKVSAQEIMAHLS